MQCAGKKQKMMRDKEHHQVGPGGAQLRKARDSGATTHKLFRGVHRDG